MKHIQVQVVYRDDDQSDLTETVATFGFSM